MIRNVIIMAHSGLVLFSKEFVNAVAQVPPWKPLCRLLLGGRADWCAGCGSRG